VRLAGDIGLFAAKWPFLDGQGAFCREMSPVLPSARLKSMGYVAGLIRYGSHTTMVSVHKTLRELLEVVEANAELIVGAWNEFFDD